MTVSPGAVTLAVDDTQQFTAVVTGTANPAVDWFVNDIPGGDSGVGTITVTGLYVAPSLVPAPPLVTVKAVSQADSSKSDTATVDITIRVTVTSEDPAPAIVAGATAKFTASVDGTPNQGVTWFVDGVAGGNAQLGTITPDGLYTAPVHVRHPRTITIRAVSQEDGTIFAEVRLTLAPPLGMFILDGHGHILMRGAPAILPSTP